MLDLLGGAAAAAADPCVALWQHVLPIVVLLEAALLQNLQSLGIAGLFVSVQELTILVVFALPCLTWPGKNILR